MVAWARSVRRVALAFAVLLAGCGDSDSEGRVRIGSVVPDYRFETLHNNDGRKSLAELRGSVVLIDWWGTHCPPCLAEAVPHAIDLAARRKADGLVCILVESQGYPADRLPEFIATTFKSSSCLLTNESPFTSEHAAGMLPFCALIAADGTLVLDGNPVQLGRRLEDAVAAELKKARQPAPDGR